MTPETSATVKLFAALRDAAQTGELNIPAPTSLKELLVQLDARFGERFAARMAIAAVMVDGVPVSGDDDITVQPGSEVALLPPFAGGNH